MTKNSKNKETTTRDKKEEYVEKEWVEGNVSYPKPPNIVLQCSPLEEF